METFIFKETKYPSRSRNNRELTIYRIKDNTPVYVGICEYSTGSTRGATHEVFNYLMDTGYIPTKYYTSSRSSWSGDGYFYGEVTKHYKILEV